MPAEAIDSNVALYLIAEDRRKADRAEAILQRRPSASVQLLNEATNVARRKLRLSWDELDLLLATLERYLVITPLTIDVHRRGIGIARRYGLGTYDALIVASALESGCTTLWSEDMHDGLCIDSVLTICNPFAD